MKRDTVPPQTEASKRYKPGTVVYALASQWTIVEHVVASDNGLPALNLTMEDGSRRSSGEVSTDRVDVHAAAVVGLLEAITLELASAERSLAQAKESREHLARLIDPRRQKS